VRSLFFAVAALVAVAAGDLKADDSTGNPAMIRGCITAAAKIHGLPPAVLVILLNVEGGTLGRVSRNGNETADIGPIQVNTVNLRDIAAHWHASLDDTYRALRDNFCANVEAGAWILRQYLDEASGNFWEAVGYYHSHTAEHKARYLREVLRQVLRLKALAEHAATLAGPSQTPRAGPDAAALPAGG
jgi:hypothetical protein